jgi:hypothetical protein
MTTMAQSQGEQISVSNPSPLLEFIVNMSYYAIHLSITSYLPIPDIISLTRTSKQLSGLYTYLLKTQYSIDKRLSPYFVDPDAFRMVQAETNALIFGDVATGFFDRSRWEDERLMIAVDDGKNFDKLSGYMQSMGYIEKMMAVRESKEFDEISEHIQQRGYMDCGDVCEEEHKREQSEAYFHPDSDTLYDLRAKFSMVSLLAYICEVFNTKTPGLSIFATPELDWVKTPFSKDHHLHNQTSCRIRSSFQLSRHPRSVSHILEQGVLLIPYFDDPETQDIRFRPA